MLHTLGVYATDQVGEDVWLFGVGEPVLGQSEFLHVTRGEKNGEIASVDLIAERKACDTVTRLWRDGVLSAAHDLSDGGLLVALAECVLMGAGLRVDGSKVAGARTDVRWFGEGGSRFILVAPAEQRAALEKIGAVRIGETISEPMLEVIGAAHWSLDELRRGWSETLPRIASGEALK